MKTSFVGTKGDSKPSLRESFKSKNKGKGKKPFKPKLTQTQTTESRARKDVRKEKRKEKKAKKHLYILTKVGKAPVPDPNVPKKKRRQNPKTKRKNAKARERLKKAGKGSDSGSGSGSDSGDEASKGPGALKGNEAKLRKQMEETRRKRLLEENEAEERNIKSLQKKLKLNKKAIIPESFRVDGLDYLLEFCDNLDSKKTKGGKSASKKEEEDEEGDDEDGMDMDMNESEGDSESEYDDGMGSGSELEAHEEDGGGSNEEIDLEADESNEEGSGSVSEDESAEEEEEETEEGEGADADHDVERGKPKKKLKQPEKKEEKYWEDIYGRMRDTEGNVIDSKTGTVPESKTSSSAAKYVPPMRRENQTNRDKIKKGLKGLLNRLSESNMHSIAHQIEDMYMRNSRNEMNETLLELLYASLVGPVLSSERIILEHVMLIAILHANVGTEIGAFFIQNFVQRFHKLYEEVESLEGNRKEMENLALLYSYMYHFKIVDCCLMYDILNFLAERFTPKDIELILAILKSVGFRLRKDDPAALKSLILILQQKASSSKSGSSRVKFMLEVLLAIRNNNMNKIPNYDPSFGEHLRKVINSHLHKGNYVSELKISMQDLLNAETKGKWWIVGSAWTNATENTKTGAVAKVDITASNIGTKENEKLLAKARAQGMNTDTRRNIFCILMTAEDYLDAFEKLVHLGLKNQLEREIIHVIVYCCLQEKKFNPYYAYLSSKFCQLDRRFLLTIQYTLWDRLKDFGNQEPLHLTNMSKFLVHLINDRSLPLTVLKVIDFADMNKGKLTFLRKTLAGILLQKNTDNLQEIFIKIGLSDKLNLFRESVKLFMGHFMLKEENQVLTPEGETIDMSFDPKTLQVLKQRVKLAERAMSVGLSKVQF